MIDFFSSSKVHKFVFLDSQAESKAFGFPIVGLSSGAHIKWPISFFKKKITKCTQLHKDRGIYVLWPCGVLSDLTLIRASFWNKQMFEGPGIFLCAEQISSFWGGTSMWLPKWHHLRGTERPFTPQRSCWQLQCIWPLFLRHYRHQAGIEMQICDVLQNSFIIALTWMNLPAEDKSSRGWRDRKF